MEREEIIQIMEDSDQKRIEYTDQNGATHKGFVDAYESEYDNDSEESSICFAGDDGEMLIVEESDIQSIRIIE